MPNGSPTDSFLAKSSANAFVNVYVLGQPAVKLTKTANGFFFFFFNFSLETNSRRQTAFAYLGVMSSNFLSSLAEVTNDITPL